VGLDVRQIQASHSKRSESAVGDLFTLAHIDVYELGAPLRDESESIAGDPLASTQFERSQISTTAADSLKSNHQSSYGLSECHGHPTPLFLQTPRLNPSIKIASS
jgi:hypothetical protein